MDEFNKNNEGITEENTFSEPEKASADTAEAVTPEVTPAEENKSPAVAEGAPHTGFVPPYSAYVSGNPQGIQTPVQTPAQAQASPAVQPPMPHRVPQTQAPAQAPANAGEYRYIPPYANSERPYVSPDSVNPYGQYQYSAPEQPAVQPAVQSPMEKKQKKEKKEKKEKKGFSAGAVALILAGCILLSFGAGAGGALLVNRLGTPVVSDGNAMVVYKTPADNNDVDAPSVSKDDLTVTDLCAKVADSVVEIDTEFKNSYGFYQFVSDGAGSGVIISADGYVVTNNHVIYNSQTGKVADSITVRLADGTEYKAEVIGRDADADIALLKVQAEGLTPAVLGDSAKLTVGQSIIAVGNPLGELGGTVTCGIVSATNREISVEKNKMNLIQIDAAINPGNSGGGVFNMKGELVGIVNAKSTGSDIDGLAFAIPVNDAAAVIEELRTNGYVTGKTYIGVNLVDVTDLYNAYYYFHNQQTGVYIAQVVEGYNDKVLQYGDRIAAIDGKEITSSKDVKDIVKKHKVGDKLKFSVSRDGELKEVTVTCYEYVPDKNVTFGEQNENF